MEWQPAATRNPERHDLTQIKDGSMCRGMAYGRSTVLLDARGKEEANANNRTHMQIARSWQWTGTPSIMEANSLHNGMTTHGHANPRNA